jgi:hypothetical protein
MINGSGRNTEERSNAFGDLLSFVIWEAVFREGFMVFTDFADRGVFALAWSLVAWF